MTRVEGSNPRPGDEGFIESAVGAAEEVVHQVAARERNLVDTGLNSWSFELQRYFTELSSHNMAALERLRACKTPFDVLKVEQDWMSARSKSYLESGLRLAKTFAAMAQEVGSVHPQKHGARK
jgi:hypothetical protein